MTSQSGECGLYVVVVPHDLVPALLVALDALHDGPVEPRTSHVLDRRLQDTEDPLPHTHGVVYLACELYCVIPHVAHCPFAMVPRIVQIALPHLLKT